MDDDPNLIAILIPSESHHDHARTAFSLHQNKGWYLLPTRKKITRDRDSTCEPDDPEEAARQRKALPRARQIQLRFDNLPLDGLSFGEDPTCDIMLGEKKNPIVKGISGLHFLITYNPNGRLVLTDRSQFGTTVCYGETETAQPRRNITWPLEVKGDGGEMDLVRVLVPYRGAIEFKMLVASHRNCMPEFTSKRNDFLQRSGAALPALTFNRLGIKSRDATEKPSQAYTPRQDPVLVPQKELGKGGCGTVYKMISNVTGDAYAKKVPTEQSERVKLKFLREINIMRRLKHDHLVPLLHYECKLELSFLMPYYSLGSLRTQDHDNGITLDEAAVVCEQVLLALIYMHQHRVAHRDIKPDNILVQARYPALIIRLSDFGCSKYADELKTHGGTPLYTAPEVHDPNYYSPAVDLWSLGVVMMEYACSLPKRDSRVRNTRYSVQAWCEKLIARHRSTGHSHWKTMIGSMLQWDPASRLSAPQCLEQGYQLPLFGPTKPRWVPTLQTATDDSEEPSELHGESDTVRANPRPKMESMDENRQSRQSYSVGRTSTEEAYQLSDHERKSLTTIKPVEDSVSKCAKPVQSNGVVCTSSVISQGSYNNGEHTQGIPWSRIAVGNDRLLAGSSLNFSGSEYGNYRKNTAILHRTVITAVAQGLADSTTNYFQLPFLNGDIKIRKRDHRLHLAESIIKAGLDRNAISKLRGHKSRNTNRVSKGRSCSRDHVTLAVAMKYARTNNKTELIHLLDSFITVYKYQVNEENAPPHVYREMLKAEQAGLPRNQKEWLSPNHPNPGATSPLSGSSTPTNDEYTKSVSFIDNGEANVPDIKVTIEGDNLARDDHRSVATEPEYKYGSYPSLVNKSYVERIQPNLGSSITAEGQQASQEPTHWNDGLSSLFND